MKRILAIVALTVLFAGCGASGGQRDSGQGGDNAGCIVLANGNQLCGDQAASWCERFSDPSDRRTRLACETVLPDPDPAPQCDGFGSPGDPEYDACARREG